jgi:hypothetical protein
MRTPLSKYVVDVVRRDHLIAVGTAIAIDFATASVRIVRGQARKRRKPMLLGR